MDAQVPVGARDRLLAASPALDGGRRRRDGLRDAVFRGPGRLRACGLDRDRRVHGALGDERHRSRRLHDRVSRQGRAGPCQRDPHRPLSRGHARLRLRVDGFRLAGLARRIRARCRRFLRARRSVPLRAGRAPADHAARQRPRRAGRARPLAARAVDPRRFHARRRLADQRHDEVVGRHHRVLGLCGGRRGACRRADRCSRPRDGAPIGARRRRSARRKRRGGARRRSGLRRVDGAACAGPRSCPCCCSSSSSSCRTRRWGSW